MKVFRVVAAAAVVVSSSSGFAQSTTVQSGAFSVSVSVTPVCGVKTNASNVDFGTYTPFTNADVTRSTAVVFRCSQGITPTSVALVNTSGTAGQYWSSVAGNGAQSAEGVIKGLRYTLGIPSISDALSSAGTAASVSNGSGNNSTAKEYTFSVTAFLPGSQAGSSTVVDNSHSWRLDLVY